MSDLTGADINVILGKNIKRLRGRKKISQLVLADHAGLTHNFINEIENGRKWISPESFAKLVRALEAEPHEFFMTVSIKEHLETEIVTDYLNDLSDTFNTMVSEIRARYLEEDVEEGVYEPQKRKKKAAAPVEGAHRTTTKTKNKRFRR
jgi:transcriptional regulator with XRE-family HTH domain